MTPWEWQHCPSFAPWEDRPGHRVQHVPCVYGGRRVVAASGFPLRQGDWGLGVALVRAAMAIGATA